MCNHGLLDNYSVITKSTVSTISNLDSDFIAKKRVIFNCSLAMKGRTSLLLLVLENE